MTDDAWRQLGSDPEAIQRNEKAHLRYEAVRRAQWLLQEIAQVCPGTVVEVTIDGVTVCPYETKER